MNMLRSFFDPSDMRGQNRVALALILFFIIFVSAAAQNKSLMADEAKHYRYGANLLNGDTDRFDDSKMPVSALNALPAKLASYLPEGSLRTYIEKIFIARFMTILISALAAWMVFFWSRKLHGFIPALISLILYILDPNIIAHSHFVATDIPMTAMMLFSCYWLWRYAHSQSKTNLAMLSLTLGLAQLAKYTAVSLYPLFSLIFLIFLYKESERSISQIISKAFSVILITGIAGLLIINIGFLFNKTFTRFGSYEFRSERFQSLQAQYPILKNIPVPVPYPFLEGFDWIIKREATGEGYGNLYMLGQVHPVKGFAGYYILASLLKVPISTQIIFWVALVFYFINKDKRATFFKDELFLLAPVLFYTIYFNFFYNAQLGIRFYLIVFPLLYIFAGSLFTKWTEFTSKQKLGTAILGVYLLVSVLSYYPHYIPYFNELIWDRKSAYQYLADSNIDWEQSKEYLKQYKEEHPEAIISPRNKITYGLLVVNANDLVGVTEKPEMYQWLRENFQPVDTLVYSYLIYQITPEQIQELCSREPKYCQ
jgi:hypothetical protein